jgi:hypothetical protein
MIGPQLKRSSFELFKFWFASSLPNYRRRYAISSIAQRTETQSVTCPDICSQDSMSPSNILERFHTRSGSWSRQVSAGLHCLQSKEFLIRGVSLLFSGPISCSEQHWQRFSTASVSVISAISRIVFGSRPQQVPLFSNLVVFDVMIFELQGEP